MTERKSTHVVSRRTFVATLLTGAGAVGCSKSKVPPFGCTDVSALSEFDRGARVALAYTDRSASPEKECTRCVQYVEADQGCGTCKIVRGPIHPNGTCKSFAAK